MNNDHFYEREYKLGEEILQTERLRLEVGLYQGVVNTNGNFKDILQKKMQMLAFQEEIVRSIYQNYYGKEATYPEIRNAYNEITNRILENQAVINYPNNGLNK